MRIIIDILHPAHVHIFKNFIRIMQSRGHEVLVTARDKDVALDLLKKYNIKHIVISGMKKGFLRLFFELISRNYKLCKLAKEFKPDVLIGVGGHTIASVSPFLRVPSLVMTSCEKDFVARTFIYPFATKILTPSSFESSFGKKHVKYKGYHELAYLYPGYFKPDKKVLKELGIKGRKKRFFILRFVSLGATHDIAARGFKFRIEFVKKLEKYGQVFITSESKLPKELEKYKIRVSPEKIHSVLYYATLFIGESSTMASEAAILGTPAIYVSNSERGNVNELERKYGLAYYFKNENKAMAKVLELLKEKNIKNKWQKKRKKMLKDKIDVTKWLVNFVESYKNK